MVSGRAATLALIVALGASVAQAAAPAERVQRTRVVTTTRFVTLFQQLEYDLVDGLRASDKGVMDKLLAADFEERSALAPATPTPREDWLKGTALRTPGGVDITQMAVHDHGDLAVVSFRMALDGPHQSLFAVDVWRRKGGPSDYELLTRYLSALPAQAPPAGVKPPDGKK
jgi:hypothetical protein